MIFSTKDTKVNRRLRRRHVLDVKLSSHQRRGTRMRQGMLGLMALLSVIVGVLLAWKGGDWALRTFVYENPAFAIHNLEVHTDGIIATDQIRHWAGVRLQDNLLALDIARVKRDLELAPMIRVVAVERVLPHTLRIRVTEREPIAQCHFAAASPEDEPRVFFLDSLAAVMLPVPPHQRSSPVANDPPLPRLSGVPVNELRPGKQVNAPPVVAALQWIEAFDQSAMADLVTVQDLDVSIPNLLLVKTLEGSAVTFGFGEPAAQIGRWRQVHDYASRGARAVASLDLSVTNNIPVTWMEVAAVPPPLPKPRKATRAKRRHV